MQVVSLAPVPVASLAWRVGDGSWTLGVVCKLTFQLNPGQAKLAKRTRERDATKKLLAKAKKELRQNMARLIDSEMERVRVEQELLRRKIEVEEKKRVGDQ